MATSHALKFYNKVRSPMGQGGAAVQVKLIDNKGFEEKEDLDSSGSLRATTFYIQDNVEKVTITPFVIGQEGRPFELTQAEIRQLARITLDGGVEFRGQNKILTITRLTAKLTNQDGTFSEKDLTPTAK